eukprot:COSAG06_NODE_1212_length_10244_cov_2.817447_9_plen_234_part_00
MTSQLPQQHSLTHSLTQPLRPHSFLSCGSYLHICLPAYSAYLPTCLLCLLSPVSPAHSAWSRSRALATDSWQHEQDRADNQEQPNKPPAGSNSHSRECDSGGLSRTVRACPGLQRHLQQPRDSWMVVRDLGARPGVGGATKYPPAGPQSRPNALNRPSASRPQKSGRAWAQRAGSAQGTVPSALPGSKAMRGTFSHRPEALTCRPQRGKTPSTGAETLPNRSKWRRWPAVVAP